MTEQLEQQPNDTTEPQQAAGEPVEPQDEPDTFPREYVEQLRGEAAESRTALKEVTQRGDAYFEMLKRRTLEAATSDLIRATSDLPADDPRYYDNNGFPSLEGMREVATELIQQKPYLAKPHGDIKQGVREESHAEDPALILGNALRGRF